MQVPRSAWSRSNALPRSASSAEPSCTATARRSRASSCRAATSCTARPSVTTSRKWRYSAVRTRMVSASEALRSGGSSNPETVTPRRASSASKRRAASGDGGAKEVAGAVDCMCAGGARQSWPHVSFRIGA